MYLLTVYWTCTNAKILNQAKYYTLDFDQQAEGSPGLRMRMII